MRNRPTTKLTMELYSRRSLAKSGRPSISPSATVPSNGKVGDWLREPYTGKLRQPESVTDLHAAIPCDQGITGTLVYSTPSLPLPPP